MFRSIAILAILLSLIAGCATTPPSRLDAQEMLHDLRNQHLGASQYEEYLSFTRIVDSAEMRLKNGHYEESEALYRLALVKGHILVLQVRERRLAPAPASAGTVAAPPATGPALPPAADAAPDPADSTALDKPAVVNASPRTTTAGSPGKADAPAEQQENRPRLLSERIVGGEGVYLVTKRETLRLVGSRLGISWRQLARLNRLNPDTPLQPGQKIHYNNRRIVPKVIKDGILVNIPERKLYLFKDDHLNATYPVAAGMSKKNDKTVWRTPTGKFRIVDKKENPIWRVPPSIQKEMEEEGEEVFDVVPPGPKNPLGRYALKTSLAGIMIHSTIRPASINTFSSHGCIRVLPEHMETLFKDVSVNMPGEIIYQPVMIEVTGDGRVFLEVNQDIYEQVKDMKARVKYLVTKKGVADHVSWEKIDQVIKDGTVIAEEVSLQ